MSPGPIKLAGVTAAAGLTALLCAGLGAEMQARTALARLIDGRPGLTVADASFDVLDGGLTLRGIAFDAPRTRLRIGRLHLAARRSVVASLASLLVPSAQAFPKAGGAPEEVAPGVASGQTGRPTGQAPGVADAENVVITYEGVTYTIPKIEIAGTTLSDADVAALLDVNSSETIEARLRRLNAASIAMPEIKADTVQGDFEQHWDQQQVLFASIAGGTAAVGSAGPGILKTKSAKGTSIAETGGLQMTGVDMGQIVHVATVTRTDDREAQQILAQSLVVSAIRLHDGDQGPSVTLASLKEAGLKARPLGLSSQARSMLLATGKPGDPAVDAFVGDIAASVSVDLLQADDLVVTPAQAAKDGPVRVARLTVTDVHDRQIGDATLQVLHYDQDANHVSLPSAELKDLRLPPTLDGKTAPAIGSLDLSGMSFDVDTAEDGQPAKRLTFEFNHAGLSVEGSKIDGLPPRSTMQVDDLQVTIRPDMSPMLIALGYPKLDVSSHVTTSYDAAAQALAIDDWTVNGVGMGKATVKLQLGKVTDAIISRDVDTQKAAVAAMTFKGIDLAVVDVGLVDRLLAYRATQDGIGVAQERENAIDLVRNKLPVLAGDPAKLKPVEDAIARFIADPKQPLHIGVTSADGLGAADAELLNDPNALLDHLSIVASTGP